MTSATALLVAEPAACTDELDRALRDDGFEVSHADIDGVESQAADLVLVSASFGLHRIALLSQRLAGPEDSPTVVVFPGEDLEELQACVRGGFDYVVPPFLPALLRTRLTSCRERGRLTRAVEEMAAVASLREYERDLSIAREIQSGFLPDELPCPPGWELAARFRPAKQVAGDFYDGFDLADGRRLGLVVADVCDKGIGAALFMALIRTLVRHTAQHTGTGDPACDIGVEPLRQAVCGTNRYLARNHLRQGYFATLFFGVLDPDTGMLFYINGGHNPPVLARAAGGRFLLEPTGPAVGMMPDSEFAIGQTRLLPGDQLFVYTDGVVEARDNGGGQFGTERMLDLIGRPASCADVLLDRVDERLRRHVGSAEQSDDITMLALRRQVRGRPTGRREAQG
ncbi:PP2C family protein-serine/threonine phosphatase [Kibdelosporangium persicum]|uniref:Serine phosphatase RsbU, regulator of sigma subunit n=1 Tax=Kibdelosporangium persicum TaxID=2698649 RepID=A0ABX2F894_9PSEU|nr:SpoIIE family protein phosphatase [Kibdelosporangium persicum]NRN67020.1 Serine phosphatase RsbU, regulator of sigma subunit [Kibdelosporangium persicum]